MQTNDEIARKYSLGRFKGVIDKALNEARLEERVGQKIKDREKFKMLIEETGTEARSSVDERWNNGVAFHSELLLRRLETDKV